MYRKPGRVTELKHIWDLKNLEELSHCGWRPKVVVHAKEIMTAKYGKQSCPPVFILDFDAHHPPWRCIDIFISQNSRYERECATASQRWYCQDGTRPVSSRCCATTSSIVRMGDTTPTRGREPLRWSCMECLSRQSRRNGRPWKDKRSIWIIAWKVPKHRSYPIFQFLVQFIEHEPTFRTAFAVAIVLCADIILEPLFGKSINICVRREFVRSVSKIFTLSRPVEVLPSIRTVSWDFYCFTPSSTF